MNARAPRAPREAICIVYSSTLSNLLDLQSAEVRYAYSNYVSEYKVSRGL